MVKALVLGLLASLFFAFTFVLNRQMQLDGGPWIWSASLRFFFMVPLLLAVLLPRKSLGLVFTEMGKKPGPWLLWSTVGFGLFYAPVCWASTLGPSWLVAATWQVTIVAGLLLTPLVAHLSRKSRSPGAKVPVPWAQFGVALVILAGVLAVQSPQGGSLDPSALLCLPVILIGAVAYPLGNRMMMGVTRLGTVERVFGMTLASLPFWIGLSAAALLAGQVPTPSQVFQAFLVALFSGVVATLLFFKATALVRDRSASLAAVESTQAGEVVFTLVLGLFLFHEEPPSAGALAGLAVVVAGIILNGISLKKKN